MLYTWVPHQNLINLMKYAQIYLSIYAIKMYVCLTESEISKCQFFSVCVCVPFWKKENENCCLCAMNISSNCVNTWSAYISVIPCTFCLPMLMKFKTRNRVAVKWKFVLNLMKNRCSPFFSTGSALFIDLFGAYDCKTAKSTNTHTNSHTAKKQSNFATCFVGERAKMCRFMFA